MSIVIVLLASICIESKAIKKLIYPKKYSTYVEKYSNEYGIDENLVYSIIKAESKFDKDVISHKGAKGLMQISDITGNWAIEELNLGSDANIYNPDTNIKIGCWYYDRKDLKVTINWGGNIEKDVIVFSYDSPLDGLDSPSHDFRYPYSITINGKDLTFNEETGRFTYVKDVHP